MFKHIAVAAVLLAIAGPVYAGTPVLDQRQEQQAQRIRQGVQSGDLTRVETRGLVKGQAQLRRMEARAKSDGEVTQQERKRLQHKASVESRKIYRQKHDRQSRDPAPSVRETRDPAPSVGYGTGAGGRTLPLGCPTLRSATPWHAAGFRLPHC